MPKDKKGIRYILWPVLLVLATICSCIALNYNDAKQAQRQAYAILSDSAAEQIAIFRIVLNSSYETLETYAKSIAAQESFSFDSRATRAQLNQVEGASSLYHIRLIDPEGNGYTAQGDPFSAKGRNYFDESIRGENSIEVVEAGRFAEGRRFILSVPLVRNGEIAGVLIGTCDEKNIRAQLVSEAFDREGYSLVCDAGGTIVIGAESDKDQLRAPRNILDEIEGEEDVLSTVRADVANGRSGYAAFSIDGESRCGFYGPVGSNGWMLFNIIPASVVSETISSSTHTAYFVTAIIMLLSLAMLVYVERMSRRSRQKIEDERADLCAAVSQSGRYILKYDLQTDTAYCIGDRDWYFGQQEKVAGFSKMLVNSRRVNAEGSNTIMAAIEEMRGGKRSCSFDVLASTRVGEEHWIHVDCTLICGKDNTPGRVIVCYYDNSLQHERELGYIRWKNDFNKLFEVSVCYMEVNLTTNSVERVSGLEKAQRTAADANLVYSQYIAYNAERHVAPEDGEEYLSFFDRTRLLSLFASGVNSDKMEFRSLLSGGAQWCRSDVRMTKAPLSEEVKAIAILTNVDSEHREREALRKQAERDSLTGIYNRKAAEDKIRSLVATQEKGTPGAFYIIDLDNLKQLNDAKGHQAGDAALRGITEAITGVLNVSGILGRLGGDELVAYLPDCGGAKAAERIAGEMSFATQIAVEGLPVTTSIGIALSDGIKTFEQLYKEADDALYHAKTSGKNRYCMGSNECGHTYTETGLANVQTVKLQSLLENMNGSIVVAQVAETIRVTYTSPSFYRMFGADSAEQVPQGDILTLICEEDYPSVEKAIRDTAETGVPTNCVYRVKHGDARWRHLHLARLPDSGAEVEIIGMISDITELKKSQEAACAEHAGEYSAAGQTK